MKTTPSCLQWIHERRVAVLGCDAVSDVRLRVPTTPNCLPMHVGTLVVMGIHLIDNADFDAVAETPARTRT